MRDDDDQVPWYDPIARRLNRERIWAQAANDDAVEEMNRRAALSADRRGRLPFLDTDPDSDTGFDRIREGRSAT